MSIGSALNHGRTLYVDAWDHHTFLDILGFQLLFAILPLEWVPIAIRVLGILVVLATCALTFLVLRRVTQSDPWAFSTTVVASFLFNQSWALSTSGEFLCSLPVCGSFALYFSAKRSPSRLVAVGIGLCASFLTKQTAAFDILAFVILTWLSHCRFHELTLRSTEAQEVDLGQMFSNKEPTRRWASEMRFVLIGASALAAAAVTFFVIQGSLREAIYTTFIDPLIYATGHDTKSSVYKFLEAANQQIDYARGIHPLLTGMFVVSLFILLATAIRRTLLTPSDCVAIGAALWLASDMFGLIMIGRFYPHYLVQIIVPVSILTTFAIAKLAPKPGAVVSMALISILAWSITMDSRKDQIGFDAERSSALKSVASFLRDKTTHDQGVFIYQNLDLCLYYFSERFPPTKIFMDHQLLPENKDSAWLLPEAMARLEANPPQFIIRGALQRSVPEIDSFIATKYVSHTNFGPHHVLKLAN
jgi:hypothetical protein